MQILEQKVNFQECLYMKKGDALAQPTVLVHALIVCHP